MLTRRIVRTLAGCAVMTASLLGAAGCGGLGPGDYITYRIAYENTKPSATCYPNGEIPTNIKDDRSTFRSGSTIILYVASDEEALLDTGDLVLTGTIDGDAYSFSGKLTDVDYPPGNTIFDADHDGLEDNTDPMIDADHDGIDDTSDPTVDVDADGLDDRFEDTIVDANNDGDDDRIVEIPSDTKYTNAVTLTIDMTVDGSAVTGTSKEKQSQTCEGPSCSPGYNTSCTVSSDFKGVEIEETNSGFGSNDSGGPPSP